ncbi:hypothetical protein JAAARDRAFT_36253 [Jaapia argillacea MUCL 33604]|uniref:F-box domain-containing protein n=1 Tax=Jaapia argillacea MUCL 33604 TaxID=933084 RepID=A0A067PPQ1_9AGAM|nr:hypothetical protein JAAARDRAFT_36253 [Jaapia argillacea MUCL 33604]
MACFLELPVELLPIIVQFVVKPSHLALVCQTNKVFYRYAIPCLYERVLVFPWHRDGKSRVVKVFRTLAECPLLARHVRRLEIREFPKALSSEASDDLLANCTQGIKNCTNLIRCTWTRDGSLSSRVLESLLECPALEDLEINGHHNWQYDPQILWRFKNVSKVSLIMPSGPVIDVLPWWIKETRLRLRCLTLICKSSPLVTDGLLEIIAPGLPNLEQLSLIGCPKVTHHGILSILASSRVGITTLGLEALSSAFDMAEFSHQVESSQALSQLRSITLTISETFVAGWMANVQRLLASSPLEVFQVYTRGGSLGPTMSDDFCASVVDSHHSTLKRFSVHRMRVSLNAIDFICSRCTNLEQLFVVVDRESMRDLGPILSKAPRLRSVHINYPLDAQSVLAPLRSRADVLSALQNCIAPITQFGCNTRVWQVSKSWGEGDEVSEVNLSPYENPDIPDQFLVMRA